jgi:hypothetical protein
MFLRRVSALNLLREAVSVRHYYRVPGKHYVLVDRVLKAEDSIDQQKAFIERAISVGIQLVGT